MAPDSPQLGFYHWLHSEAFVHHGNFADAERALIKANQMLEGRNQVLLHLLAGTQLQLGKSAAAKAHFQQARALGERPIQADRKMWEVLSSDAGGEHYRKMWDDLESFVATLPR